jgi:hypothetical protein
LKKYQKTILFSSFSPLFLFHGVLFWVMTEKTSHNLRKINKNRPRLFCVFAQYGRGFMFIEKIQISHAVEKVKQKINKKKRFLLYFCSIFQNQFLPIMIGVYLGGFYNLTGVTIERLPGGPFKSVPLQKKITMQSLQNHSTEQKKNSVLFAFRSKKQLPSSKYIKSNSFIPKEEWWRRMFSLEVGGGEKNSPQKLVGLEIKIFCRCKLWRRKKTLCVLFFFPSF